MGQQLKRCIIAGALASACVPPEGSPSTGGSQTDAGAGGGGTGGIATGGASGAGGPLASGGTGGEPPEHCRPPGQERFEGSWLVAYAQPTLHGKKPALMAVHLEQFWEENPVGVQERLRGTAQYLDARDGSTKLETTFKVMVDRSWDFRFGVERRWVPGAANQLLHGIAQELEVTLIGDFCGEHAVPDDEPFAHFCGTGTGTVFSPVEQDLAGTTFGAVRIENPEEYPDPVIDCDGTLGERAD